MIKSKDLYDKRNEMAEAAWEKFPEALQNLILTMFHSNGEYGVSEAIRYLSEHKVSMSDHSGTSKLTYLRWVDKVFRNMYLMFEFEDSWGKYGDEIEDILLCANGYIRDLASDYNHLSVMPKDEMSFCDNTDLVRLSQDFDMFFCTLYWYKEEHEKFEEMLEKIFDATKRNVSYMLQHEYAAELKELDFWDMDDFLPMEFYYWENIAWLYHGGGAAAFPQLLIQIYEEYVSFLYSLEVGSNWKTRNELVVKAEEDLQFLYELDIDRVKDDVSDDEYPDYIEQCEQKVQESKERVDAIKKPYAVDVHNQECEDGREEMEEKNWEAVWAETRRLLSNKTSRLSFSSWIESLSLHYVDKHNMIMYLLWPENEKLVDHLNKNHLEQIENEVKMIAPEIEHIEILPANNKMMKQYYHRKWGDLSNRLRELLLAYKTTPAVIFLDPDNDEIGTYMVDPSRTEIVEGFAHNPETGEFTEKVIAIRIKKPRNIDDDFFVPEEEIPF